MNETKIFNDQLTKSPAKATGYIGVFSNSKTNQPFKKQLIKPETNNNNLNTSHIENRLHTNQNSNSLNTYTNCSQQAIEDDSKKIGLEGKNKTLGTKFNPNDTEDLEIQELTELIAEAKLLEKKAALKKEIIKFITD